MVFPDTEECNIVKYRGRVMCFSNRTQDAVFQAMLQQEITGVRLPVICLEDNTARRNIFGKESASGSKDKAHRCEASFDQRIAQS